MSRLIRLVVVTALSPVAPVLLPAALALGLGLLAGPAARAQQLSAGVRAGANLSSSVGADATQGGWRFAYHAGVLAHLQLTQRLALQPEVLYSVKGDKATLYGPSITAKLSYLEVPLLARYTYDGVFVEAGPALGYLLGYRFNAARMARVRTLDTYQRNDLGAVLGFGYQDPGGMSVSWRYVAGLRNVYRPVDIGGTVEQVRMRNGVLHFTLGYLLPWKLGKQP